MALSDVAVRQAKATNKNRELSDSDGLSLFVPVTGHKAWHYRYVFAGKRTRLSLGLYPEVSLLEARRLRDKARAHLAKGLNPRNERERERYAVTIAGEHTFQSIYDRWLDHRRLSLDDAPRGTLQQIESRFEADVFPLLKHLTIVEVTRPHLLDIIARIEKRGSLSMAEKMRTWFGQLFRYARVVVPGMTENPATDLDVVAVPLPPVNHNPFLRLPELPEMLQSLRKYGGRQDTQLAVRLLLLTGVRTGELRFATPEQFDLERGLWIIPVTRLKQREKLKRNKRQRISDIPPYIVPLSLQAKEIVQHLMDELRPAQVYLFAGQRSIKRPISENTTNTALKRMGYEGRLTGHGIRATISTALNELGYLSKWVDAQLSHADPNQVSAIYNHAEYVEQRRVMMQDWADRLDLLEQNHVELAGKHLTVTLQGLPMSSDPASARSPIVSMIRPIVVVEAEEKATPAVSAARHRLSAVAMPDYAKPKPSDLQLERRRLLEIFEAPHNLRAEDYAKLVGKSRRWVSYEIQARHLLALSVGHRGVRVPDWQLDPLKGRLVRMVLAGTSSSLDTWAIYDALTRPLEALQRKPPIDAVTVSNLDFVTALVCDSVVAALRLETA
jgi:integrase